MTNRDTSRTQKQMELILELYKRIPHSKKITLKELQAQLVEIGLERHEKTIQRNLDILVECLDVEKDDRSRPYGYTRRSNDLLSLGRNEALLLLMAEEYLSVLLPHNLKKTLDSAFYDAKQLLSRDSADVKEREWLKKIRSVNNMPDVVSDEIDDKILNAVKEALYHNRWLTLEHREAAQTDVRAEVMPLGLVQQGSKVYLVCREKNSTTESVFSLQRITRAAVSSFSFEYPADFKLERFNGGGRWSVMVPHSKQPVSV
jgi:predicted DNA-binding transcriptional regulator YafY